MEMSAHRAARLLEAGMILSSELSLSALLQRLVELAVELTGARYGALGVIDDTGTHLVDFITTGISAEERAAIGALPQGRGILGVLITDAKTLRLTSLGSDSRSVGFPPHHPPMTSFLGAPVRAHGRVFGNIYLTEKQGSESFTEEDEDTIDVLATQAGVAIWNARLYGETQQRQQWLEALGEISAATLDGEGSEPLARLVARRARELVMADSASVVLPVGGDRMKLVVADGAHAADLEGLDVPIDRSVSGQVVRGGDPIVFADALADPRTYGPMVTAGDMGPAVFVPLAVRGARMGTLAVSRVRGGHPFEARDPALLSAFADQAALALAYARAQGELKRLTLLDDRERIARELHDGVIQALFAVGLGVQGTAALLEDQVAATRLQDAVNEIDRVIGDLRNYIFGLRPGVLAGSGLGDALGQLAHDFEARTGITTAVDVDVTLEEPLASMAPHLVQLTRESLSNVGRHAQAATCRVSLRRQNGRAVLEIDDDGVGFDVSGSATPGMGLGNLRSRAESLGGELELSSPPGEGTTVRVSLPLEALQAS